MDRIVIDQITSLTLEEIHDLSQRRKTVSGKEVIQKELESVESQIERLMKLYAVGRYDMDTLDRMVLPLEEKKISLNSELRNIKDDSLSEDDAVVLVESFSDVMQYGGFIEKKAVIDALIDRIEIDGDDLTIHWKFS